MSFLDGNRSFESARLSTPESNGSPEKLQTPQQLSSKELAEYVTDRVLNYITHELAHGTNFFNAVTTKFSDLFKAHHQPGHPKLATTFIGNRIPALIASKLAKQQQKLRPSISTTTSSLARISTVEDTSTTQSTNKDSRRALTPGMRKACTDANEYIEFLEMLLYQLTYSFIQQEAGAVSANFDRKLKRVAHAVVFNSRFKVYETVMKLIEEQVEMTSLHLQKVMQFGRSLHPEDFNVEENFCLHEEELPFLKAIEAINMTRVLYTPEEKMQAICYTKNEIIKAIDDYWRVRDPNKKASELAISADQLLPLYSYILARSGDVSIKATMLFIEEFLDPFYIKYGEEAYFFATLNVAVNFLSSSEENSDKSVGDETKVPQYLSKTSRRSGSPSKTTTLLSKLEDNNPFQLTGIEEEEEKN